MGAADPQTPPIVVPIFVRDSEQAILQMQQAAQEGADWIELRCDEAWHPVAARVGGGLHEKVRRVLEARPRRGGQLLPIIMTYRSQAEGGGFAGTDADLTEALLQAAQTGVEYLDVEFAAWRRSESLRQRLRGGGGSGGGILHSPEHPHGPRMILSAHDFTGRPADLHERIAAMGAEPAAAVIKMAWHAAAIPNALEALQLVAEAPPPRKYGRPLLALTMGEFGQLARLLGAKFGQPFTFATLGQGTQSAPGQPSIQELRNTYRWAAQQPGTSIYGVIGWPVGHSLSPAIHNAGFAATGFDGVYVPLPIEPSYEAFASTVDALRACPGMNLRGLSVTIPHKENALRYVRERGGQGGQVDPLSAHIGAINTIVFQATPSAILGVNSDYSGAMEALRGGLKQAGILPDAATPSLEGIRVAVLGAGGAARAIIAGLAHANATSVIYNRTLEKAQQLAAEFTGTPGKVVAVDPERLCLSCCQVYINCTPLGMHPHPEQCPVSEEVQFTPGTVVFDTIYNPLETQLLKRAKAGGATTVPGLEMFVRQAGVQFKLFTGQEPPLELFRTIALGRLSPDAGLGK